MKRDLLGLLVFVFVVALVGLVGSLSAVDAADSYALLDQPAFAPPAWLFGPVWTVLYVMIAVSGWLVWRAHPWTETKPALTLYAVQLLLNAAWTPLFFAAGLRGLALVVIVGLIIAIGATIWRFWRLSRLAAGLLVPYLLWVGFAAVLNASVWWLNR